MSIHTTDEEINKIVDSLLNDTSIELFTSFTNLNDKSLSINKIKETDELLMLYNCEICQEENNRNINKIVFICGHDICGYCLNQILKTNEPKCPYCRKLLNKEMFFYKN